jgi:hypothetical protein
MTPFAGAVQCWSALPKSVPDDRPPGRKNALAVEVALWLPYGWIVGYTDLSGPPRFHTTRQGESADQSAFPVIDLQRMELDTSRGEKSESYSG